jgi:peptidoglycan/LPS O-acetylase OafA/YrhL
MKRGLSVYLDLLRVLAALQVAVFHLSWAGIGAIDRGLMTQWGHEAVVVFFVLSGFVIRHAAATSDHTFAEFAISRISRLYSVILPCLALTIICDLIGRALVPNIYANVVAIDSISTVTVRAIISILMLNQRFGSIEFFSNATFWSVCYEFWYYFLFAAVYYLSGMQRVLITATIGALAGLNVLLLLPVWLMGVAAYAESRSGRWSKNVVIVAFAQPVVAIVAYQYFGMSQVTLGSIGVDFGLDLRFSKHVVGDTVLALSFSFHLVAAKQLDATLWHVLRRAKLFIGHAAARSFTLYMLHLPVMFLMLTISTVVFSGAVGWFITLGTIGIPLLVAGVIESQRYALRAWLRRVWQYWQPGQPAVA